MFWRHQAQARLSFVFPHRRENAPTRRRPNQSGPPLLTLTRRAGSPEFLAFSAHPRGRVRSRGGLPVAPPPIAMSAEEAAAGDVSAAAAAQHFEDVEHASKATEELVVGDDEEDEGDLFE